jgi:ABC-type transporter Mla subunit MlaD
MAQAVQQTMRRMRFAGLAVAVVLFVVYWAAPVAQVADSRKLSS